MKVLAGVIITILAFYLLFVLLLYVFQEHFIMHPKALKKGYQYDFSNSFQEYFIDVEQGVTLNALHFTLDAPKGIVLYFHGNTGELDVWGTVADDFLARGFEVFMIDYRGYGKSTGKIKQEDDLHADAEAAYLYMRELVGADLPVIMYGRSLGSGVAAKLATKYTPQSLILETPYNNMLDVVEHHTPWYFPNKRILRYRLETDKILTRVACPVFAIHGTKDPTIPYVLAEKLKDADHPDLTFIQVAQAQHNNLIDYMEFGQLLDQALGPILGR